MAGRGRTVATGMAVTLPTSLLAWWLWGAVRGLQEVALSPAPISPAEALTLLAATVALALALWLLLSVLVAVLAFLPGRVGSSAQRLAATLTPAAARRAAALLVGATLGGALAPGTAVAGSSAPTAAVCRVAEGPGFVPSAAAECADGTAAAPSPGWVPDRPLVRRQPSTRLLSGAPAGDESPVVVVRRGDTLWGIARAQLGPDATEAEVAAAWPRWHDANRAVIGDDPDLLLPGQRLRPPSPVPAPSHR